MPGELTLEERGILLDIARQSLQAAVCSVSLPNLDLAAFSPRLRSLGACFVTLTIQGELRGCIGALEPYQPLALDVREHAVAAALQDFRFPPVTPAELDLIEIEISCLTPSQPLAYQDSTDLLRKLRPGIDGVVLRDGFHRATFLPQVWEKIPDPAEFLDHLCMKLGAVPNLWRLKKLQVFTYQVEEFHSASHS